MDNSPLLEASKLRGPVIASSGRPVFSDVSLSLAPGELVLISGESGSGKSTLLRALAKLRPDCTGQITFRGVPQVAERLPVYRRCVSYVAQTPPRFDGSVEDSLRLAFDVAVADDAFDPQGAKELVEALRLPKDVLARELTSLSGGESQRVSLVRALLTHPVVLLLDEPTSALDETTSAAVREVLAHWLSDGAHAVVTVTHDAADFVSLATRQLRLFKGQLESVS